MNEVQSADCVAIFSGGLDSTTLVYSLVNQGYKPHCLSFDYGQRHAKELQYAAMTAGKLGLQWDAVDLHGLKKLLGNSALTSSRSTLEGTAVKDNEDFIQVPDGHYTEESMKLTVVPNRNMIMLSIAAGVAVSNQYRFVATGVHAGDHAVYPDCRPRFVQEMNLVLITANQGFHNFDALEPPAYGRPVYAPYIEKSKEDIAYEALELGVPLVDTWSCYKGGELHCGRCGTCVERLEAIAGAQQRAMETELNNGRLIEDQTKYEDTTFWKVATEHGH